MKEKAQKLYIHVYYILIYNIHNYIYSQLIFNKDKKAIQQWFSSNWTGTCKTKERRKERRERRMNRRERKKLDPTQNFT
jgi:hypothetical protein